MKTTAEHRDTQTIGAQTTNEFTIAASAKAFRVLSDGLYSDKILTVVRELSTNAYDAHVEAGTQAQPFDVQFPNSIDPIFRIRDYGIGLSFEDTMHLYSTYFFSTKTDTNKQIGALGLGSKSPFGYTDGFTVISFFNGDKMVFNCNIGKEGIPTISHMRTVKTNEPNGLEISFAVKQQNFQDFKNKATDVWRHFNPAPNVTGVSADEFKISAREYVTQGKGWKVYAASGWHSKPIAVMGLIEYPIDYNKLVDITDEERSQMCDLPIEVAFDIGDLEISTNRESLGYDARTSRNLVDRVLAAFDELVDVMQAELSGCKTLWDARIKYRSYCEANNELRSIINSKHVSLEWKGQKVDSKISLSLYRDTEFGDEITVSSFTQKRNRNYESFISQHRSKATYDHNDSVLIPARESVEIYVDDLGRGSLGRIKSYMMENNKTSDVFLIQHATKEELKYIRTLVGMKKFKEVSTLPAPVRAKREKGQSSPISVWTATQDKIKYTSSWHGKFSQMFKRTYDVDYSAGGLYVNLERVRPYNMPGFNGIESFQTLVGAADKLGLMQADQMLIGVTHTHEAKLVKQGNWIELTDAVRAALTDLITDKTFNEAHSLVKINKNIWTDINSELKTDDNIDENQIKILLTFIRDNAATPIPSIQNALDDIERLNVRNIGKVNNELQHESVRAVMNTMDITATTKPIKISILPVIQSIIKITPVASMLFTDSDTFFSSWGKELKEDKIKLITDLM